MGQKKDWHPADIIAALHKRKMTLAGLSRSIGLSSGTLRNALRKPWVKGEWLIAESIGITPEEIWPTRYYDEYGNVIKRYRRAYKEQNSDTDKKERSS